MNRGGAVGSALGAGVLALLLLRGFAPGPVTPTPQPQSPGASKNVSAGRPNQTTQPVKARPEEGPWKASQEHFAGMQSGDCPVPALASSASKQISALNGGTLLLQQGAAGASSVGDLRKDFWCIPAQEQVQAMIAVAPDPVHTHLPLTFDRTVEAIQLAAQSMNYVSDRYWLPWDAGLKPQFTDYESSEQALKDQAEKESQPGLLLYRWNGNAQEQQAMLLYVFVVADTPSTGLNGRQFSNAVEYVREICNKNSHTGSGCSATDSIRIMGPTFSGSLASLRQLTAAWEKQKFTAYSGTLSSECALQNQGLLEQPSPFCEPLAFYQKAPYLTVKPFVSSSESSIYRFIDFLGDKKQINCNPDPNIPPKIAILSEAATSFGSASTFSRKQSKQSKQSNQYVPRCKAAVVNFSYPRDISTLRNAYETSKSQAVTSGSQSSDATRTYLPLNLSEQLSNRSDEPPDFSPQGPLSKEAVLMKFAAELRRGHYQYIGISGSNVLDLLFLANFLRTACPDARLFAPDADLLFERDLDNASYIGSLAVSTYPLISENLDWTHFQGPTAPRPSSGQSDPLERGPAPRLPFADQFEQSLYNATLDTFYELLDRKKPQFYECRAPFSTDQNCSPEADKLPLWVEVVGTGGYWPVEVLSPTPGTPKHSLEADDFSLGWKGTIVLLCVVGLAQVWILLTSSPRASHFRDFSPVGPMPWQRLFLVHVFSASLVSALWMLLVPWFRNWWPVGWDRERRLLLLIVILALLTVSLVLLTVAWRTVSHWFHAKAGPREDRKQELCFRIGVAAVWAFAVVVGGMWYRLFAEKSDLSSHYGLFFAYRTMHLESGVSPIAPIVLLLALIYLWSLFEVWRLRFNDQERPRLSRSDSAAGAAPAEQNGEPLPGTRWEQSVADSISKFWFKGSYAAAFVTVFLIWLLFFRPDHPFQLFEQPAFRWVYELLFMLAVAIMLSSGFRFGQIWSELRSHLLDLEMSPIRYAFGGLKKEESWSPIWRLGGQETAWTNMARSFEVVRQMRNCPSMAEPLKQKMDSLLDERRNIRTLYMSWKKGERKLPRFFAVKVGLEYMGFHKSNETSVTDGVNKFQQHLYNIQDYFAAILNEIWPALDHHWAALSTKPEECDESGGDEKTVAPGSSAEADETATIIQRQEEYAALRYKAFIRGAMIHMKHTLIFAGIAFSMVLLSLNIYSFEPHKSLIWSLTIIFIAVGFTVVRALMQMHRDRILSLMTGTKPNELGIEFYIRVIGFGAVPALTLIATHFPAIGKFLVSFLQPGLEALK